MSCLKKKLRLRNAIRDHQKSFINFFEASLYYKQLENQHFEHGILEIRHKIYKIHKGMKFQHNLCLINITYFYTYKYSQKRKILSNESRNKKNKNKKRAHNSYHLIYQQLHSFHFSEAKLCGFSAIQYAFRNLMFSSYSWKLKKAKKTISNENLCKRSKDILTIKKKHHIRNKNEPSLTN